MLLQKLVFRNVRKCVIQKLSIQAASAISETLRCWPWLGQLAFLGQLWTQRGTGVDVLTSGKSCARCQEPAKEQHPILGSREAFSHLVSLWIQVLPKRFVDNHAQWTRNSYDSSTSLYVCLRQAGKHRHAPQFWRISNFMQSSNCHMYSLLCVWTVII